MKQDRVAVCSLLDAILERLKVELTHVRNLYMKSDYDCCYQNDLPLALLPCISSAHELSRSWFVHDETQRGKSLVDAQLEIEMKHLSSHCTDCSAEMVHIWRYHVSLWHCVYIQERGDLEKLPREYYFSYKKTARNMWTVIFATLSNGELSEYENVEL